MKRVSSKEENDARKKRHQTIMQPSEIFYGHIHGPKIPGRKGYTTSNFIKGRSSQTTPGTGGRNWSVPATLV